MSGMASMVGGFFVGSDMVGGSETDAATSGIGLSGAANATSTATASLGVPTMAARSTGVATTTANNSRTVGLSASSAGTAAALALLGTRFTVSVTAHGAATVSTSVRLVLRGSATSAGLATASASLARSSTLLATSVATATTTASVFVRPGFSSVPAGRATVAASSLRLARPLAASVAGHVSVAATTKATRSFTSSVSGTATCTAATIRRAYGVQASAAGHAATTVTMRRTDFLAATAIASATTGAELTVKPLVRLNGRSVGSSTGTGSLRVSFSAKPKPPIVIPDLPTGGIDHFKPAQQPTEIYYDPATRGDIRQGTKDQLPPQIIYFGETHFAVVRAKGRDSRVSGNGTITTGLVAVLFKYDTNNGAPVVQLGTVHLNPYSMTYSGGHRSGESLVEINSAATVDTNRGLINSYVEDGNFGVQQDVVMLTFNPKTETISFGPPVRVYAEDYVAVGPYFETTTRDSALGVPTYSFGYQWVQTLSSTRGMMCMFAEDNQSPFNGRLIARSFNILSDRVQPIGLWQGFLTGPDSASGSTQNYKMPVVGAALDADHLAVLVIDWRYNDAHPSRLAVLKWGQTTTLHSAQNLPGSAWEYASMVPVSKGVTGLSYLGSGGQQHYVGLVWDGQSLIQGTQRSSSEAVTVANRDASAAAPVNVSGGQYSRYNGPRQATQVAGLIRYGATAVAPGQYGFYPPINLLQVAYAGKRQPYFYNGGAIQFTETVANSPGSTTPRIHNGSMQFEVANEFWGILAFQNGIETGTKYYVDVVALDQPAAPTLLAGKFRDGKDRFLPVG